MIFYTLKILWCERSSELPQAFYEGRVPHTPTKAVATQAQHFLVARTARTPAIFNFDSSKIHFKSNSITSG